MDGRSLRYNKGDKKGNKKAARVEQDTAVEPIKSFGEWLRRRRRALDLTQAELAQQVGCAAGTIKSIEADTRRPSKQLAERLANVLDLQQGEKELFLRAARAEFGVDKLLIGITSNTKKVDPATTQSSAVQDGSSSGKIVTGTLTFLFTDIERSTRLWEQFSSVMNVALARHDAILQDVASTYNGVLVKRTGDGVLIAFSRAIDALLAAVSAQQKIFKEDWGIIGSLAVRMALHTGVVEERAGDYYGKVLNRTARLLTIGHGGQILLSLATAGLVQDDLPVNIELRNMGEHRLKDLTRPEQVFQVIAPDLSVDFPPLSSLNVQLHNLPIQLTSFIGRENEVATVSTLLRRDAIRLVTLTGTGGIGKTRLSLQVATDLTSDFADGIYFVDLAPIRESELVLESIAYTIGVVGSSAQPLRDRLIEYLKTRQILLILDNFEQIIAAAPRVVELLTNTVRLKIVVTSRVALQVRGEQEYNVPSLPTGALRRVQNVESLQQYSAVKLFIERAREIVTDFTITNDNALAVIEICQRLDGLPLAIELAARRIKYFSPQALLAQLSQRFAILTNGPQDAPQRQQTLRSTIDWSYKLLNDIEQQVFVRLAVFVGGFTLEAAEFICQVNKTALIDYLIALIDANLLRSENELGIESRFVMLETIHEYALEQLTVKGQMDVFQRRHAEYYLELVERREAESWNAQQTVWFAEVSRDLENIRAALKAWRKESDRGKIGRIAAALAQFWHVRSRTSEGRHWIEEALGLKDVNWSSDNPALGLSPGLEAKVLRAAGELFIGVDFGRAEDFLLRSLPFYREARDDAGLGAAFAVLGDLFRAQDKADRARTYYEEAFKIFHNIKDVYGTGYCLFILGYQSLDSGDVQRARILLEESLTIYEANHLSKGMADVLSLMAIIAFFEGDYMRAIALNERVLVIARELGYKMILVDASNYLGAIACIQGEYDRAISLLEDNLEVARELQDEGEGAGTLLGWTMIYLGYALYRKSRELEASTYFRKAFDLFQQDKHKIGIAASLDGLAEIVATQGYIDQAHRLWRVADSLAHTMVVITSRLRAVIQQEIGIMRTTLKTIPLLPVEETELEVILEQISAEVSGEINN